MKLAALMPRSAREKSDAMSKMFSNLTAAGHEILFIEKRKPLDSDVDMLLSIGGDGTFLFAAALAAEKGVPVLGVNAGRLGFLSENTPETASKAIISGEYMISDRMLLDCTSEGSHHIALNDVVVSRTSSAMLGVDVILNDVKLPTYWADGLIVSTPSGSTAYSMSVGGPIVMPDSKVLIITPIAPHNLNVRPLVVPAGSKISMKFHSRDGRVQLSADNESKIISSDSSVCVNLAQYSLKRVCLKNANFIGALSDKLYWGEDLRNIHIDSASK